MLVLETFFPHPSGYLQLSNLKILEVFLGSHVLFCLFVCFFFGGGGGEGERGGAGLNSSCGETTPNFENKLFKSSFIFFRSRH